LLGWCLGLKCAEVGWAEHLALNLGIEVFGTELVALILGSLGLSLGAA
jgi:hypothetical protein